MVPRVPDLWRLGEDADHLYRWYLSLLQMHHMHDRTIAASRRIRHYAARGPGAKEGLLTFHYEVEALYDLKNYAAASRQLRLRDRIAFGKSMDYARQKWCAKDAYRLEWDYAPIHYFLGRYSLGCSLLETSLSFWFPHQGFDSYSILHRVYNGDEEPWHRARVTLANFYDHLGKRLSDWQHWSKFASSFHPTLYRLGGISRKNLVADSDTLLQFFENLDGQKVRQICRPDGKVKSYVTASSPKFLKYKKEQKQQS